MEVGRLKLSVLLNEASSGYASPHAARRFLAAAGRPLPRRKDWNDPVYRQWIDWSYARRLEIWDINNRAAREAGAPRKPREGTKQATLIAMLRAPDGATIEEIMAATGWQSHTVRGAFAGALKKKLGLTITSEKIDGRGRVYRITN